ncbi:MAG: protein-L-isoaspartate(D-aspartate) O-methyltransferase [Spirochaetota bacterium]
MENLKILMVKKQIVCRGIKDKRVIEAMKGVERHLFVPDVNKITAYEDRPLPIGYGQTISQPYIVALMTELCRLKGHERVLEIGTGSGYQTAILSLLAKEVYSIEVIEPLAKQARNRLKKLNYDNVHVIHGDGYRGLPEKSPFDVIILTASPPKVPPTLVEQLSENGILVAPEGTTTQELVTITKSFGTIKKETISYVIFVPMVHMTQN